MRTCSAGSSEYGIPCLPFSICFRSKCRRVAVPGGRLLNIEYCSIGSDYCMPCLLSSTCLRSKCRRVAELGGMASPRTAFCSSVAQTCPDRSVSMAHPTPTLSLYTLNPFCQCIPYTHSVTVRSVSTPYTYSVTVYPTPILSLYTIHLFCH